MSQAPGSCGYVDNASALATYPQANTGGGDSSRGEAERQRPAAHSTPAADRLMPPRRRLRPLRLRHLDSGQHCRNRRPPSEVDTPWRRPGSVSPRASAPGWPRLICGIGASLVGSRLYAVCGLRLVGRLGAA
jgi:hypothetical protein